MLQKVSFSINRFQLTELQNHALDPSVTFRQLTASKVLERTLQVTSVTLWKSERASNKEAVGAGSPYHLAAFGLSELPASIFI